ncbi:MAG TPA: tRNA (adenosine(37)-N6)-threonylcarbamoyltransferase complex transferase subunit TsaD [Acholeplasmataceae bacterium]|nr:tRNA (adenosine(37)-N6)-threonylcarbamoyltransferase complex transferase subunit TsaD [Acholeplasmataceae bacterium]
MIILSVESSCDETSVAIIRDGKEVLSHIILSQIDIHKEYGGVVPEIASRNHIKHIVDVFDKAIKDANIKVNEINLVAVTEGPGLIGSLLVGINAATAFAYANNIKIIGVNHLIGHIYAAQIENEMQFPLLALLVSGGHTELIYMKDHFQFEMLGTTLDDAVGEAYDKVARTLGLSYPGGPIIDKLAKLGNDTYDLPRVYLDDAENKYNFSFSGLKSAVINKVHNLKQKGEDVNVNDMATSFQNSVIDVLVHKTKSAANNYNVKQIILAGGVAANQSLRKRIKAEISDIPIIIPKLEYCTDNAAMIGAAAYQQFKIKYEDNDYIIHGRPTKSYN